MIAVAMKIAEVPDAVTRERFRPSLDANSPALDDQAERLDVIGEGAGRKRERRCAEHQLQQASPERRAHDASLIGTRLLSIGLYVYGFDETLRSVSSGSG